MIDDSSAGRAYDSARAEIARFVGSHRGTAVAWLRAFVALDSEAPGELAAQSLLVDVAESVGLDAELIEADHDGGLAAHPRFVETGMAYEGRPNCVVRIPGRAERAVICNAHIDTVAVGDGWTRNPYGDLDRGRLYGRGACDAKGSLVAALLAATCVKQLGSITSAPIEIHSVVDEEPGGNGTLGLLRALASRPGGSHPRLAVIMEPTRLDLLTGHRGMLWYGLTCVGKQAHGATPLGVNAIEQAADVVQSLRALNERFSTWAQGPYDPPRLNVGMIRGGHEVYTTPGLCTLDVSVRYAPGQREDVADAFLAAMHEALPPEQIEVRFCRHFEAAETPADTPAVTAAFSALRRQRPTARLSTLGGTCDMRHYRMELKAPSVIFGPGDLAVAHTAAEFVDIDEVLVAAQVLADTALSIAVESC
jgi:acetylornithine deacetylase/succinyl-diaminopimelate desuccinylase-like protein